MHKTEQSGNKTSLFTVLFTVLVLLAYGLQIRRLSFYGDDWIYIYNYHIAGPEGFIPFTRWDRPFSAWIYILASSVFGESVLPYHLLLLVQRWLSVFLFHRILRRVWGERTAVHAAVLLFALYPGFMQQPIAVQYIMHFASLDLGLFSILCILRAVDSPGKVLWQIAGVLCAAAGLFTCEYFVGLEGLRPFLLWFLLSNTGEDTGRFSRTLKYWWPYLLTAGVYLYWRVFIFSFKTYGAKFLDDFRESPANALPALGKSILRDLKTVLYTAYRNTLRREVLDSTGVMILIAAAFLISLFLLLKTRCDEQRLSFCGQMLLCGIVCLLASGVPYWMTKIDVTNTFPWDRSTLSFSPAAALVIAALLCGLLQDVPARLVCALICAVCVGFHYHNAGIYVYEAGKMNDYFWQLAWRAPGLEAGTILASDEIPLNRYSDGDLTPVVNQQYAPEVTGYRVPYKYFDLDLREEQYYSDPKQIVPVEHTYRCQSFSSTTEKTLGIFYREGGCLQVIDGQTKDYPGLPESLQRIVKRSDPSLILAAGDAVPPKAIGAEPEHGFCYDFQKIGLSLQQDDLSAANGYAQDIIDRGLIPTYASDWAPVFAALLLNGGTEKANALASGSLIDEEAQTYICKYLKSTPHTGFILCDGE